MGNVSFARIFHKLVQIKLYLVNWYEFILFNVALTDKLSAQGKVICAYVLDNQPPSKRKMFEETRARKEGRTYKQSNGDTLDKIVSH